jgi:hypothetical protein
VLAPFASFVTVVSYSPDEVFVAVVVVVVLVDVVVFDVLLLDELEALLVLAEVQESARAPSSNRQKLNKSLLRTLFSPSRKIFLHPSKGATNVPATIFMKAQRLTRRAKSPKAYAAEEKRLFTIRRKIENNQEEILERETGFEPAIHGLDRKKQSR